MTTTGTEAAPLPTSTSPVAGPSFRFHPLSDVTTCGVYDVRWTFSSHEAPNVVSFAVNLDVAGVGDNFTLSDTTIATNVSVLGGHFKWDPVNIGPGQYEIFGRWSDTLYAAVLSQVFDVKAGNTTACLTSPTTSSSSSSSSSSSAAATASPASSSNASAGDRSNSGAAIIWISSAAVAVAIIAGFVIFFLRYFRRRADPGVGPTLQARESPVPRGVGSGIDHRPANANGGGYSCRSKNKGDPPAAAAGYMTPLPRYTSVPASVASLDALRKVSPPITPPLPPGVDYKAQWGEKASTAAADVELTPISSSRRSVTELFFPERPFPPGGSAGVGGGDGGSDRSRPLSSRRSSRATLRKPVPAYTPTPEELEAAAASRPHSERSLPRSEVMAGPSSPSSPPLSPSAGFRPLSPSASLAPPSLSAALPPPSPSAALPPPPPSPSPTPSFRMSSTRQSTAPTLRNRSASSIFDGHQHLQYHYLIPDPPLQPPP